MAAERDNHPHDHSKDHQDHGTSGLLRPLRLMLALPVWLYQKVISPAIPAHCIYTPSCSEYTRQAILRFGLRGLFAGVLRVGRCVGSLYEGGEDAVPDRLTADYLFGSYKRRWSGRRTPPE